MQISVCTWSLQKSIDEVNSILTAMGVDGVHLALLPALKEGGADYLAAVKRAAWRISSTMLSFDWENYTTLETIKVTGGITPDEHWDEAREMFTRAAAITKELGAPYISLHAGFIDPTDAAGEAKFAERVKALADIAATNGIMLLMETGQEKAADLASFLTRLAHPALGINFDPANMILYNKDNPLEAVKVLAPWIRHVHAKDAVRTHVVGEWGSEVPWGEGEVNVFAFLTALKNCGVNCPVAVEREASTSRVADIALAVRRLRAY